MELLKLSSNYIPSLDGIRAVSVFLVLLSHAGYGNFLPGGFGVTVFFFLSGFLITTLLIKEYKTTKHISYSQFFVRRFFRLFPPLLLCLLLVYLATFYGIVGGQISLEGLLAQVFYLANYSAIFNWQGPIPDGLGVLWSLAVEEHFYLVFPFLFYMLLHKLGRVKTVYILVFLCGVVLLWRNYLVLIEQVSQTRTYYATDTRIDSILFGSILALTCNPIHKNANSKLNLKAIVLIFSSIVLLLFTFTYRSETFRETFRYSIQGIALMPLFYYSIKSFENPFFSWLNWQWLKKFGVFSYCIYLVHHVIIKALKHHGIDDIPTVIILTIVLSSFFAYVVDKYVDVHFRKLREKFR